MFELHQLEQFLAVVENGTVSKAAEKLNITQPALSRSLQNLEYELKTPLFNRSKNRMTLSKTGEHAALLAKELLSQSENLLHSVREFHRTHSRLIIASCAPCELLFSIRDLAVKEFYGIECETLVESEDSISQKLSDGSYSMGIFSKRFKNPDFIWQVLASEELSALIPEDHFLAKEKSISFSQINGEAVIPFPLKGHWNSLLEKKLPDSQLLYQNSIESYDKVVHASSLISFESNFLPENLKKHVRIPIIDDEARITYHLAILKSRKEEFRNFLRLLSQIKDFTVKHT